MAKHQTSKDEKIVQRPARLPQKLWIALDAEASRCRRSSIKQLEAILLQYYEFEDVNLHFPSHMVPKRESTKERTRSNDKNRRAKSGSKIRPE